MPPVEMQLFPFKLDLKCSRCNYSGACYMKHYCIYGSDCSGVVHVKTLQSVFLSLPSKNLKIEFFKKRVKKDL